MVVAFTRKVRAASVEAMVRIAQTEPTFFGVTLARLPDAMEIGYPGACSHLFVRSMETCATHHPGSPVLFCEPDTAPMGPDWFHRIEAEYIRHGEPHMGEFV